MYIYIYISSIEGISRLFESLELLERYSLAHHVGGGAERFVEQTFDGQPLDGTILVVPEAMVILREQVPGQGVVRDLNSQIVVNAENERERKKRWEVSLRKREKERERTVVRTTKLFLLYSISPIFKLIDLILIDLILKKQDICCLSSIYYFIENVCKKLNN